MPSVYIAMGKRKPSPRAERRTRARAYAGLARDVERLARLAPGGAPDRPIPVEAPTQVEPIAAATPCPHCDGPLTMGNHAAETHGGVRLRVAHVRCASCGVARALYFRLVTSPFN